MASEPTNTNWVKSVIDVVIPFLRDYVFKELQALVSFEGSREEVLRSKQDLEAVKGDLEVLVRSKESPVLARTNQVILWMERVDKLVREVKKFDRDNSRSPSFPAGCCPPSLLWRRFQLVGTAPRLIRSIGDLRNESQFDPEKLVTGAKWDPGRGISDPLMVGAEDVMRKIHACLDGDKGVVGIYGMGGVGKTTILDKVRYAARQLDRFQQVIWVELRRGVDVPTSARKSIAEHLRLSDPEDLKVHGLRRCLGHQADSFLLLLDNVWKEINLSDLGLAETDLGANRKIVFTTRLRSVCDKMGAEAIKVNVLKPKQARKFFKQSMGKDQNFDYSPIEQFVEDVVSECGGLPLALKIVARMMASKLSDDDWRDAVDMLKESPDGIPEVLENVFKVLSFSFDNLDDTERKCLLFCALFPDGHDINGKQLAEYWVAEGLLAVPRGKGLKQLHMKGRGVISNLKSSCLLEEGRNDQKEVRMHDVVRDVALWKTAEKFFVYPRWKPSENDAESWETSERISIMQSDSAVRLPRRPKCPKLSTLLIRHNSRNLKMSREFFGNMPALRVLDFTATKVEELPPEIGNLTTLRYLNLSHTTIRSLPEELGRLEELRHLNLSYTAYLKTIPKRVMSGLKNLWTLNMFNSRYDSWEVGQSVNSAGGDEQGQAASFTQLEDLSQLQEFGLNITSLGVLERFLKSTLLEATAYLHLVGFVGFEPRHQSAISKRLENLQELHISHFAWLRELASNQLRNVEVLKLVDLPIVKTLWNKAALDNRWRLRCLEITQCHELTDVDWVRYVLCLETMSLSNCNKLQDVMKRGDSSDGSSGPVKMERLKEVTLTALPALEGICGKTSVKLSALRTLTCSQCPKLASLPLERGKDLKLVEIQGEQKWWDGLRWESEEDKAHFKRLFKPMEASPPRPSLDRVPTRRAGTF